MSTMLSDDEFHVPSVYLGFGSIVKPEHTYRLLSHYIPLGKIGGKPSWLNPINIPASATFSCRVCDKPMAFLVQIYATSQNDQDYSFHRTIYVFICRDPSCSRPNDASNMRAFRCTLPRLNDFYSPDKPIDPDIDGDVPDPYKRSTYPNLCEICGISATKKCGRCESSWYCCRWHQATDWRSHKSVCSEKVKKKTSDRSTDSGINQETLVDSTPRNGNDTDGKPENVPNTFLFPEYAIDMGTELVNSYADSSDEEDDDDGNGGDVNDADVIQKRMEEFKQYVKRHQDLCDISNAGVEDTEDPSEKDIAFEKFSKIVSRNPEQVLRYDRGGRPLIATNHAPPPQVIPSCTLCGSHRQYELQLMPHLLSLINVDNLGKSIDWATILIYSCAKNCRIAEDGYSEEFVFKQDFN